MDAASTSQQNISKHLTRLMEHGYIARDRHGSEHGYELIDPSPIQVLDLLSTDLARQLRRLAEMIGHHASTQPSGIGDGHTRGGEPRCTRPST